MTEVFTEAELDALDADEDEAVDWIVETMAYIDGLKGQQREIALLDWRRSDGWHPLLMMCADRQGKVAREAYTVGLGSPEQQSWHRAFRVGDRPAIMAALKVDPADPGAGYACDPFRIVSDDGKKWIAAAVGCEPSLPVKPIRLWGPWLPIDIEQIILWRRDGETRVLGEAKSQAILVEQFYCQDSVTVYKDTFTFFRAWIEARAAVWVRFLDKARGKWNHPITETRDGNLPGALVVGDIAKIRAWPDVKTLIAGPGTDADALRKSVWASYSVPRVVGAPVMRAVV